MRIQHNIMAMSAYRNYTNNVSAMKKNLEKLSSGYKINRAGDDAAGLAISEKMRAQITGLETAQKNAKDGISLVQTAEGALTEVHDMLNRMVELATQSANGTYEDGTDRAQLQKEVNQLREEINRIADSSNFNGINLLDGSMSSAGGSSLTDVTMDKIHDNTGDAVAAAQGEYTLDLGEWKGVATSALTAGDTVMTISFAGQTINVLAGAAVAADATIAAANLKLEASVTDVTIGGLTLDIAINGGKITLSGTADPTQEQVDNFNKENLSATFTMGTSVTANNAAKDHGFHAVEAVKAARDPQKATGQFTLKDTDIKDGTTLKIGDTTYTFKFDDTTDDGSATTIHLNGFKAGDAGAAAEAARLLSQRTHAKFDITTNNQGGISLTERDGWGATDYENMDVRGDLSKDNDATWTMKDGSSIVQLGGAGGGKSLTLQIGDTAAKYNQLKVDIQDMHCKSLGISTISVAKQSDAQAAIDAIKAAINKVSDVRGTLGATQNRLDHTINNLSVMTENIQDAESTIRDTDVAEEMMAYTKNNILIQSAQAMLAQANQVPQGVLQLLQ